MKSFYKNIILGVVVLFALPLATIACCCAEPVSKVSVSSAHSQSDNNSHSHDHSDHDSKSSSHDHSLCNHAPINANLISQTPIIFAADSGFKILALHLFLKETTQNSVFLDHSFDHGPPGPSSAGLIPLYLQNSNLRI